MLVLHFQGFVQKYFFVSYFRIIYQIFYGMTYVDIKFVYSYSVVLFYVLDRAPR